MLSEKKNWLSSAEMYAQVRELVSQEYGVDIAVVEADDDLHEDLGGKSEYIDIWEFLGYLEDKFRIKIPILEVTTVKELAEYREMEIKKAPRSI